MTKATHISVSLIDHIYIQKTLQKEFSTNVTVENMYFLDHGTVRIVIQESAVDFGTFHEVKFDQILKENCFSRVFTVILISEFSQHG